MTPVASAVVIVCPNVNGAKTNSNAAKQNTDRRTHLVNVILLSLSMLFPYSAPQVVGAPVIVNTQSVQRVRLTRVCYLTRHVTGCERAAKARGHRSFVETAHR
jgi:hypothetical protein